MNSIQWDAVIVALIVNTVGLIGHFVHDMVLFTNLRRDVKWMKAIMRKHGLVAPNGDGDNE